MYLVYLDDSGDEDFQMVGAVIVPEREFLLIETYLAETIDKLVPEEIRDKFEFHASALFNGKDVFAGIGHDAAIEIFKRCVTIVEGAPLVFIYGAVNTKKLRGGIYATARPIDIAFRACLNGLSGWFEKHINPALTKWHEQQIGMFICDDTKNGALKTDLQKAFRAYRRQLRSSSHERGLLKYVHDDMYFGDSSYSVGIQLADVCSYIVLRHLQNKDDTEFLYRRLEPHLFYGITEPDGNRHGNPDATVVLIPYNDKEEVLPIPDSEKGVS